jgi:two-component system, NtrC family, response regulator GlrR
MAYLLKIKDGVMKNSDFTIVVAEDDPGVRKIYQKALSLEGYNLILAESGARALAEIMDTKVDLLITDLKMDNMSALELLPVLKHSFPVLPIIVVSGCYHGMVEGFHQKGFNVQAFIQKPASMTVLKDTIHEILNPEGDKKKSFFNKIAALA